MTKKQIKKKMATGDRRRLQFLILEVLLDIRQLLAWQVRMKISWGNEDQSESDLVKISDGE